MDQTTYTDPSGFDPGTVSAAADQLRVFLVADGYGGKTGSDSVAGGCLAFFTQVMGQGEGSDTSALLDAAGDAAEQLVDSASSAASATITAVVQRRCAASSRGSICVRQRVLIEADFGLFPRSAGILPRLNRFQLGLESDRSWGSNEGCDRLRGSVSC